MCVSASEKGCQSCAPSDTFRARSDMLRPAKRKLVSGLGKHFGLWKGDYFQGSDCYTFELAPDRACNEKAECACVLHAGCANECVVQRNCFVYQLACNPAARQANLLTYASTHASPACATVRTNVGKQHGVLARDPKYQQQVKMKNIHSVMGVQKLALLFNVSMMPMCHSLL